MDFEISMQTTVSAAWILKFRCRRGCQLRIFRIIHPGIFTIIHPPRGLCRVFLTQFNHVWQASLLVLCFLGCYSRPAAGINHRRPVVTVDKPSPFYRSAYPSNCGKKQRSVLLFSIVAAVSTGARPTARDVSFWFLHSRPTSVPI